jgi:hypothetical protein
MPFVAAVALRLAWSLPVGNGSKPGENTIHSKQRGKKSGKTGFFGLLLLPHSGKSPIYRAQFIPDVSSEMCLIRE